MAVLLAFFMYLPVAAEGVKSLRKYCKARKIGSYGDGPYCSRCLLEKPKYDGTNDDRFADNIVDPATHEHKDSIYVRTDPQLL